MDQNQYIFLTYRCHAHGGTLTQYLQLSHFQTNAFLRAGRVLDTEFSVENLYLARNFFFLQRVWVLLL